ncbi:NfeD family protein [Laspinema olomoucense]|uniref:NfeD family protein n=1 Tax=Laspinema olomoucense TaxID=3231600 RepID=UPI0021BA63AF|nr:NfeD family protein [Laspinema sp. D3c]MCT7997207.1 NfeD family protein [Laspinema sp. D3c]
MGVGGVPTPARTHLEEIEKQAIVDEAIVPHLGGRVRFQSSWWPALCQQNITLLPGEIVYVVGRYNLILLVEPSSFFKESQTVTSSGIQPSQKVGVG